MILKKLLGFAAIGALLIVAAPAKQAQAATRVSPGIAVGQSDAGKLTTQVHHVNGQPHHHHDHSRHGRNHRHHHHHWQNHYHHHHQHRIHGH